jgi:PASTA domain/PEP-CTERM motif
VRAGLCRQIRFFVATTLLGAMVVLGQLSAAPIVGETQEESAGPAGATAPLAQPVVQTNDTVIEFCVQPSTTDLDKMETIIVLQRSGGRNICVNQNATDLIVRAYTSDPETFTPTVPSEIVGLTTGHRGQFVGFNDSRLFIKPATEADLFNNPNECFTVDGLEGCFVPTTVECDQQLKQGDYVCVADVIRQRDCNIGDHTDLERQLRIMLALNAPLGTEAIITAAGIRETPELTQAPDLGGRAGGLPTGFGAAPDFSTGFSGSGGSQQVAVPNVVGLPLSSAQAAIDGAQLTVGRITASQQSNIGQLGSILIGAAYAQTGPGVLPTGLDLSSIVVSQTPTAGTLVDLGTAINLIAAANAAIPEPSTLNLSLVGFGLVLGIVWLTRRRVAR